VLHLTELRLNSQLTNWRNAGIFLAFCGNQPVADIDHRFDLQSESGELRAQAIDVNVKAFGIERLVAAPDRAPRSSAVTMRFGVRASREKIRNSVRGSFNGLPPTAT
jgi:hypothetical protein